MQPKGRMTIRFDTPQPPKPPKSTSLPNSTRLQNTTNPVQSPQTSQPSAYSGGPLQDDHATLEQLIRRASAERPTVRIEQQTSLENIPEPESMYGQAPILDDDLVFQEHRIRFSHSKGGMKSAEEGPSWWKVFLSAAGAIVTGALFGYLVLTLFTGDSPISAHSSGNTQLSETARLTDAAPSNSPIAESAQEQLPVSAAGSGQEWPGATYYWLQYGVFRSEEAMDAAVQELRDAGLPGFRDPTDGFRVYAGVTASKAEAEQLAGQMSGRDLFIKPIEIGSVQVKDAAVSGEWNPFIQHSRELADELSRISVAALQDKLPGPLDPDKLAELKEIYGKWRSSAAAVERLPTSEQQDVQAMIQALNTAMDSIEQYERKVSRYHMWSIQAELMEMLASDMRWHAAIAVSAT